MVLLHFTVWHGEWNLNIGAEYVQQIDFEVEQLGITPEVYWFPARRQIGLVKLEPASSSNVEQDLYASTVKFIDLGTGKISWENDIVLDIDQVVSTFWDIPSMPETLENGGERLWSSSESNTWVVDKTFTGFVIKYPRLTSNFPFGGDLSWRTVPHYFGQVVLVIKTEQDPRPMVELRRTLFNSTYIAQLGDIATWLPKEQTLLIDATDDQQMFLIGPFE